MERAITVLLSSRPPAKFFQVLSSLAATALSHIKQDYDKVPLAFRGDIKVEKIKMGLEMESRLVSFSICHKNDQK